MEQRDVLIYLSYLTNGNWNKMFQIISSRNFDIDDDVILKRMANMKSQVLTFLDPEYPSYLKEVVHPPLVLFYYGDISLISNPARNVSIVGMRKNSSYGEKVTRHLSGKLSENFVIVSGLARGIDAISHEESLNCSGRTVAVLGSGIDYCYPPENKELYERIKKDSSNLIISEYPSDTVPEQSCFPERNRLIAAFSNTLIVTEAERHSGTSITVDFAISMNKTVCAVPADIIKFPTSLCNKLIREGAAVVTNIDDVYDEVGINIFSH